jgi:hypothetical protein
MADRGAMKERHLAMAAHPRMRPRPQPLELGGQIEHAALATNLATGATRRRSGTDPSGSFMILAPGWVVAVRHYSYKRQLGIKPLCCLCPFRRPGATHRPT